MGRDDKNPWCGCQRCPCGFFWHVLYTQETVPCRGTLCASTAWPSSLIANLPLPVSSTKTVILTLSLLSACCSHPSFYFKANIQLFLVILSLVEETPLKYPFFSLESCLPPLLCPDLYLLKVTLRMSVKTHVSWSVVKVQGRAWSRNLPCAADLGSVHAQLLWDSWGYRVPQSPALSSLDPSLACPQ